MQTLILPGYSKTNKEWVDETAKFDPQEKAELIAKHIKKDNVNIIAKDEGLKVANILKTLIPNQITSIN